MPTGVYARTVEGRLRKVKRPCFEENGVLCVPLTRGMMALASVEDKPWIEKYNWSAQRCDKAFYAVRRSVDHPSGKSGLVLMHREVLRMGGDKLVDHQDGNTLNNRRDNLREASTAQNAYNKTRTTKSRRFQSSSMGVVWHPEANQSRPWRAYITKNRKIIHLGYFETELEAKQARDEAARKLHGVFAATTT